MARSNELESLVQQFVSQLQNVMAKQIESELAGRFDAFRSSIFPGGNVRAARVATPSVGRPAGRRSPLAGREAELKPCPVCGTPNKARRFSYLCEQHRTGDNLAKFKGGALPPKAAPAPVAAKKAAPAKAAKSAGKRGPGRPKGSKNKKSSGKSDSAAAQSA